MYICVQIWICKKIYYIILCYIILYYIILYYTILYYIILYYIILYYIILYCGIGVGGGGGGGEPNIYSILISFEIRVGQTGPFLKKFQLRYSGPVKRLRNGLN